MAHESVSTPKAGWLEGFFPGYSALVMSTGIVAVAARLLHHEITFIGMSVRLLRRRHLAAAQFSSVGGV